jgi:hypothetical protein
MRPFFYLVGIPRFQGKKKLPGMLAGVLKVRPHNLEEKLFIIITEL